MIEPMRVAELRSFRVELTDEQPYDMLAAGGVARDTLQARFHLILRWRKYLMNDFQAMACRSIPAVLLCVAATAWHRTDRKPKLRTWNKWAPSVVPLVSFSPMVFVFGWNEIGVSFGALLLGQAVLAAMMVRKQPDVWTITGISAEQVNLIVEKALAKSGVSPERSLGGLRLDNGYTLGISHTMWLGASVGQLTWEPGGSWKQQSVFRSHLADALRHVDGVRCNSAPLLLLQIALLFVMTLCVVTLLLPDRMLDSLTKVLDEALRRLSR